MDILKRLFNFMSRDFVELFFQKVSLKMYESMMQKTRNCKHLDENEWHILCRAREFCDRANNLTKK